MNPSRRQWLLYTITAFVIVGAIAMTITIAALRSTVERTDDHLNCLLYEHHVHRIAVNDAHEASSDHHGFILDDNRPSELPEHLRRACETILPGITGETDE